MSTPRSASLRSSADTWPGGKPHSSLRHPRHPRHAAAASTSRRAWPLWLLLICVVLLGGCASVPAPSAPLGQASFAQYRDETRQWIAQRRAFTDTSDAARRNEIDWNGPQEWRPQGALRGGILLVHGLGDSPWSYADLGPWLASHGYLARTVLLPGHGTQPSDMLTTTLEEWQRVVDEQTAILQRDLVAMSTDPRATRLWLGGFSTGANLVTHHAYGNPAITGLLLFSPAYKASTSLAWLTPIIRPIRPWLVTRPDMPALNAVRYLNTPTNGFAQFYYSSRTAIRDLEDRPFDRPVFMVLAEHDSVLDTPALLDLFHRRFPHPQSRLVWYGQLPDSPAAQDPRLHVRADHLPQYRISRFSHMGILFAQDNPLYGSNGSLRICWNGQTTDAFQQCQQGAPLWFSDWGYQEADKIHARLTFNPYLDWQNAIMQQVLDAP